MDSSIETPAAAAVMPKNGGRLWRVARATLIVSALGAAGGALSGIVLAVGLGLVLDGFTGARDFVGTLAFSAVVGAALGLLLGPLAGFGLLRRVPLGRAILGTGVGTVLGFLAGWPFPVNPFYTSVAGFALAAVFLQWRYRPRAVQS